MNRVLPQKRTGGSFERTQTTTFRVTDDRSGRVRWAELDPHAAQQQNAPRRFFNKIISSTSSRDTAGNVGRSKFPQVPPGGLYAFHRLSGELM